MTKMLLNAEWARTYMAEEPLTKEAVLQLMQYAIYMAAKKGDCFTKIPALATNEVDRLWLTDQLKKNGYDVLQAGSGAIYVKW